MSRSPRSESSAYPIIRRLFPGRLVGLLASLLAPLAIPAFAASTGLIQGHVYNASTSSPLQNARVTVVGSKLETFTDDTGAYQLTAPLGTATVSVTYVGLESKTTSVSVTDAAAAQCDFDLQVLNESSKKDEVVTLATYTVVEMREMNAQALALNERQAAPNIKNVVAFDEFGDRGDENIGEFLRFLPGVSINDGGQIASNVSLRGFPSAYSIIMLDGAPIAGARGNSRTQSLLDVAMGNMAHAEITKSPTPDMPASGLGGSINLVTRSGLGTKKPVVRYQAYLITDGHTGLTFSGGPRGLSDGLSPRHQNPSLNFSAIIPFSKKFAVNFGGSETWRLKPMEGYDGHYDTQADWNLVDGFERASTFYSLDNILQTWTAFGGFGWKLSPVDTLTFAISHRFVSNDIMRDIWAVNYGTGATGDYTYTESASAKGSITQGGTTNQETGSDTTHATLKFSHIGRDWRLEAFGAYSFSETFLDDIDNGHFNGITATTGSTLKIRGEGIGESSANIPVRYSATNSAGDSVDIFDGSAYYITAASSNQNHITARKMSGHIDASRSFDTHFPLTLKTGFYLDQLIRDQHGGGISWSFNPNGQTTTAARNAGNFDIYDEDYLKTAPTLFGQPMRWISLAKVYDLYLEHPDWFVRNEAGYYTNRVNNSRRLIETISASYLSADLKLFNNRLQIVGGVRFEHTNEDGYGPLNDPSAQYQKDGDGNLILDGSGKPILITTDAYERARLRYTERGAHSLSSYGDLYPSINVTYRITDKLYLRAAYSQTIGRPDYGSLIPGAVITDPGASGTPRITVNNTALKPLSSNNYDLSLESYRIKGGFGSIGIFHKDISNFFGSITQQATPELLDFYGIPVDPLYLGYDVVTKTNAGDAQITGYELTYNQSLLFLPHWARGFQLFFNGTKLQISGSNIADFTGFAPEKLSGGINFVRPRFFVKLNFTYQGETRGSAVAVNATNGIPEGTYDYQGARFRMGLNVQYSLSKRYVLFGSMSDINGPGFLVKSRRYADGTPEIMRTRRRQDLGSTIQIGIKGTF